MKNLKDIEIDLQVVKKTPNGFLPIFFSNIEFNILSYRGKKIKRDRYKAKKIVCKGTFDIIKESDTVKKRILFDHLGRDKKNYKKVNDFDLSKIEIVEINILHFMGYGIK